MLEAIHYYLTEASPVLLVGLAFIALLVILRRQR